MPENTNNLVTFFSALLGAIGVFIMALYKDNRTHKRIDATDQWLSNVEKSNIEGIRKVEASIKNMDHELIPLSNKIDELSKHVLQIRITIDDEKKHRIETLERADIELRQYIKELEDKLRGSGK